MVAETHDLLSSYRILRVPPDASPDAIKKQYRRLARIWHPDRFAGRPDALGSAEEKMKALNAAYLRVRHAPLRGRPMYTEGKSVPRWKPSGFEQRVYNGTAGRWRAGWYWRYADDAKDVPLGKWERPCPNCNTRVSVEGRRYAYCPACGIGFFPHKEGYADTSSDGLEGWRGMVVTGLVLASWGLASEPVLPSPLRLMAGAVMILSLTVLPAWLRSKLT